MAEENDDLCRFYQKGFCKFRQHCHKRHKSQICKDLNECRNKKCQERHPQVCKYFAKDQKCRYSEKCAYLHTENLNAQDKLNAILGQALTEQIKITSDLMHEVNELKTKVGHLENQMKINQNIKKITDKESNNELETIQLDHTLNDTEQDNIKESSDIQAEKSKILFQCEECDYSCDEQSTLTKHKNTKHTKLDSRKNAIQDTTEKDKFHCDECNYSCVSKKSLKKHKSQKHEITKQNKTIECDKCEMTFQHEREYQNHVEEEHCLCTSETVCDSCLNYWVHKSQ